MRTVYFHTGAKSKETINFNIQKTIFSFRSHFYLFWGSAIISESQKGFIFVVLKQHNPKTDWTQAVRIFSEISTWVIVPIVVALVLGKYLDSRYETEPWIFLSLTGFSFVVSIGGIAKILAKYIKEIEKENQNKK